MRYVHFMILILCAAVGLAQAQPSFTLKYRFAEGKPYRYADTTVANVVQEMMGQEMKSDTKVVSITRLVAEKPGKEGLISLVVSLDQMTRSVKNPRQDTTMEMPDFLKKRSRATITPLGEMKRWEVLDSIIVGGQMGRINASTRDFFRVVIFSGKPVKVGEKWTATKTDSLDAPGGKMATETKGEYTLVALENVAGRSCLKITFTGKVTMTGKSVMGGMDIFTEGGGTVSGTTWFDEKAGVSVRTEGTSSLELTAALTGPQNMTIPITQSGSYTSRLLPE